MIDRVDQGVWVIPPEKHNCPIAQPSRVIFNTRMQDKIDRLNRRYTGLEWFAYLLGKEGDDHTVTCIDLQVPKQAVSSVSVKYIVYPADLRGEIVGTVHSHNTLGAFISPQDERALVDNYEVSIVVSDESSVISRRTTTPCGNLQHNTVEADVVDVPLLTDYTARHSGITLLDIFWTAVSRILSLLGLSIARRRLPLVVTGEDGQPVDAFEMEMNNVMTLAEAKKDPDVRELINLEHRSAGRSGVLSGWGGVW